MPAKNQSSMAIICILTGTSATLWLIHLITAILHAKDPNIENISLMQAAAAFDILAKLALVITSVMVLHNIPNEGDYRYALLVGACSSLVLILACGAGFTGNLVTEKASRTRLIQSVGLMQGEAGRDSFWNASLALIKELKAQIESNETVWYEIVFPISENQFYSRQSYSKCLKTEKSKADKKCKEFLSELSDENKSALIDADTNIRSLIPKKDKVKKLLGYTHPDDPNIDEVSSLDGYHYTKYAEVMQQYQEHKSGVELLQQIELGFEVAFMINLLVFLTLVCWVLEQKYWDLIAMLFGGIFVLIGFGVALGIKKSAWAVETLRAVFYALVILSQLDIMVVISRSQNS